MNWTKRLDFGSRILLGSVFLGAGLLKFGDLNAFAEGIATSGVFPLSIVGGIAVAVPLVEVVLGLLLLFGYMLRVAALGAIGLLVALTAYLVFFHSIGGANDCGCFGILEFLNWGFWPSLGRNLVLLMCGAWIYFRCLMDEIRNRRVHASGVQIGLLILLGTMGSTFGSLEWESQLESFTIEDQAETVQAQYRFRNVGSEAVTIEKIDASCGCVVPKIEKKRYEPGETGTIDAIFTVGSRTGMQRKVIKVQTDQEENGLSVLMLEIALPDAVNFSEPELVWEVGDPPEPKQILASGALGIRIRSIQSTSAQFQVEFKSLGDGNWEITAAPETTDKPFQSGIRVQYHGRSSGVVTLPVKIAAPE